MSKSNTPLGAVFELQRATIEQTGKLVQTSLTLPKMAGETLGASGEDGGETQVNLLDSSRESAHQSLEAIESLQDDDAALVELHDSVDAVFDILEEHQEEAMTTYEREYERVEADLSETVDSNVETLLDVHEEFESQILTLFETVDEQSTEFSEQTRQVTESTVDIDLSGSASEADESEEGDGDETTAQTEESVDATESPADEAAPEDEVACCVCGDSFAAITHPHLQTHDMTISEYRDEFGEDVPLRPDGDE